MTVRMRRVLLVLGVLVFATARAAHADVCITIDEGRDMLPPVERQAALRLIGDEFERAGEPPAAAGAPCGKSYTLAHVQLGRLIVVTLGGDGQRWEGRAFGLEDLAAVYRQIVRSVTTGKPMDSLAVVDRTDVTTPQAAPKRMQADTFNYARVGYGVAFGRGLPSAPAFGFGYRAEMDTFGIDAAFFNMSVSNTTYGPGPAGGSMGSIVDIRGLHFFGPTAQGSVYAGGGLGFGVMSLADGTSTWHGGGLQLDATAGYEFARATTLRAFVQVDAAFPIYTATSTTYSRSGVFTSSGRWIPTLTVSVGVGWHRGK
jgi:hypothetical protein